jgi:hypothetical protein
MAGFIYIMSNPAFASGLIKIGKSDRDPDEFRKNELEGTGVPEPFNVEYYPFVDDHHRIEKELHETFGHARANKQREFLSIQIEKVIKEIKRICEVRYEVDRYSALRVEQLKEESERVLRARRERAARLDEEERRRLDERQRRRSATSGNPHSE